MTNSDEADDVDVSGVEKLIGWAGRQLEAWEHGVIVLLHLAFVAGVTGFLSALTLAPVLLAVELLTHPKFPETSDLTWAFGFVFAIYFPACLGHIFKKLGA